jgi:hypothetical protein
LTNAEIAALALNSIECADGNEEELGPDRSFDRRDRAWGRDLRGRYPGVTVDLDPKKYSKNLDNLVFGRQFCRWRRIGWSQTRT